MAQQNPSPLDVSRPGVVSNAEVNKEKSSARRGTAPLPDEVRGEDLKKARGMESAPCGHNEEGTDQKVADAKRLDHSKQKC